MMDNKNRRNRNGKRKYLYRLLALILACEMVISSGNLPAVLATTVTETESEQKKEGNDTSTEDTTISEEQKVKKSKLTTVSANILKNASTTTEGAASTEEGVSTKESSNTNTDAAEANDIKNSLVEPTSTNNSSTLDLSTYNEDLYIYNYQLCTDAAGEPLSYTNRIVSGSTDHISVHIGNQKTDVVEFQPINEDIPVEIAGVGMTGSAVMHILPVGNSNNIVDMEIVEASSFATLEVEENANLEINVNDDLNIDTLDIGENASLVINVAEGKTITITNFNGNTSVDLTITGSGNVIFTNGLSVDELLVEDATVAAKTVEAAGKINLNDANVEITDGAMTALGNITMTGGTVEGATVFGYTASAKGTFEIVLEDASFTDVQTVGATEDCPALVTISGTVSGITNTSFIQDYTISYLENDVDISTEIDAEEGMERAVSYRVKYVNNFGSSGSILGYFKQDETYKAASSIELPEYTRPGYTHIGWLYNDGETALNVLEKITGNVILQLQIQAKTILVSYDLDFVPGEGTNETKNLTQTWEEKDTYVFGDAITLSTPSQFGHEFLGWEITTGTGEKVVKDSYVIEIDDLDEDENGQLSLSFVARWKNLTFPVAIALGSVVPVDAVEIYDYETQTWVSITSYSKVKYENNTVEFLHEITYKDSLEQFFTEELGGFPIFRDSRTETDVKKKFDGWLTSGGKSVNEENQFIYGDVLLGDRNNQTLEDFQSTLERTPVQLKPVWSNATFTLKVENCPKDWFVVINGDEKNPVVVDANGFAEVDNIASGAKITLMANKDATTIISNWSVTPYAGETDLVPLHASERKYASGDAFLYYDTEMPFNDLRVTFSMDEAWLNLADGDITFKQSVTHNNRTMYGFWHSENVTELTYWFQDSTSGDYFYIWKNTQPIYVTTENEETTNQLKIIGAQTVYMKDVNLVSTDAYTGYLAGKVRPEFGDYPETAPPLGNLDNYGNIVIDNSENTAYTSTLYFLGGNNKIAAITHGNSQTGASFLNTLSLQGINSAENGSVEIGTVWGYFNTAINNLSIVGNENPAPFLFYTTGEKFVVTNSKIVAPYKSIYTKNSTDTSYSGTEMEVLAHYALKHVSVGDRSGKSSYIRIHGDVRSDYGGIYVSGHSSMVIDGNVSRSWFHQEVGASISTDGYVIVKGNFANLGSFGTISNGTFIANAIAFGRSGTISDGTVITNLIMNSPQKTGSTGFGTANKNGDDYPFVTYNQSDLQSGTQTLSGGDIFLFGHYKVGNNRSFDSSVQAIDEDNPVSTYIAKITDENGDLDFTKSSSAFSIAELENAVKTEAENNEDNPECFALGNSSYVVGVNQERTVNISGNVNLHAAGNLTFFNDTTISGGNIVCYGDLTSKQHLSITSGTIQADTIGNSYALTTTNESGMSYWQETVISGGNITAGRIGAPEGTHLDGKTTHRSLTVIENVNAIKGTPKVYRDIYVNYIMDSALFENVETNPQSIRFEQSWNNRLEREMQLEGNTDLSFSAPIEKNSATGEALSSKWLLDNIKTKEVTGINVTGDILNGSASVDDTSAYDRDYLALYAAKDKYTLYLKANDHDALKSAKATIADSNGSQNVENLNFDESVNSVSVNAGAVVTLELKDDTMLNKTVVWYFDGNGVLHNTMPIFDNEANTISFEMPTASTEIWITDELTLDLYKYSISLIENGFGAEYDTSIREDSVFSYKGDLIISQSNLKKVAYSENTISVTRNSGYSVNETSNKIRVEGNFDNSKGPKVTLEKIYQSGDSYDSSFKLEEKAKAVFCVNGSLRLHLVQVLETADFTLRGTDSSQNAVHFHISNPNTNYVALGNFYGKTGNIALENLHICTGHSLGYLAYGKEYAKNSTVKYINCTISSDDWYNRMCAASNVVNVIFDNCSLDVVLADNWPGYIVRAAKNVQLMNGTEINVLYGPTSGSSKPTVFYTGRSDSTLEINDSKMSVMSRNSTSSKVYQERVGYNGDFTEVKLIGESASLSVNHRLKLNRLVLDGGTVTVGNNAAGIDGNGYLLCPDIVVNSGTLNADYVILSGYYNPTGEGVQNKADFEALASKNQQLQSSGQITINTGGKVNASTFIGGDIKANITVNGGTLTAGRIGTYGALMGYTTYMPKLGEEYVYFYKKIPSVGTVVNVIAGKVNVNDTLGGMYSKVCISGGEVNVADGAYVGLSAEDYTTLKNYYDSIETPMDQLTNPLAEVIIEGGKVTGLGHINTPYGTAMIKGIGTQVTVKNVSAAYGQVTIQDANSGIEPMHADKTSINDVGVLVTGELSARKLYIRSGAKVCAGGAYALVDYGDNEGVFKVEEDAYLCATDHGVTGGGSVEFEVPTGTLWSARKFEINYTLNQPTDKDIVKNHEENPLNFTVGNIAGAASFELLPAICVDGRYVFDGWYAYPDYSGDEVKVIYAGSAGDQNLFAKWKPLDVEFKVVIQGTIFEQYKYENVNLEEEIQHLVDAGIGVYDKETDTFTFNETIKVPYLSNVSSEHLNTADYNIRSYLFQELKFADAKLGEQFIHGTGITAAMANAYLNRDADGVDHPTPIVLYANMPNNNRLPITLNLDQKDNHPDDAKFDILGAAGKNSLTEYIQINKTLGTADGFKDSQDNLITASATGYTFDGWFTEKEPASDAEAVTKDYLITPENAQNFYAEWTPITYDVQFKMPDNLVNIGAVKITLTDNAAADDVSMNGVLNAKIVYDTEIDGSIIIEEDGGNQLPYAWKEGYVFKGWKVKNTDIARHNGTKNGTILNDNANGGIANIDLNDIVFEAIFEKVKVNYHIKGGEWTNGEPTEYPDYLAPLAGYTFNAVESADEKYFTRESVSGVNDNTYAVVSTNSTYFANNDKSIVEDDYRKVLYKKGYTFLGWNTAEDGNGTYYGTIPQYEHITVYAQWKENNYKLNLNTGANTEYAQIYSGTTGNLYKDILITVNNNIPNTTNWPKTDEWYAYNSGYTLEAVQNNPDMQRYLLGFTFDWLDPGYTEESDPTGHLVYKNYGLTVTELINDGYLFTNDGSSKFEIPGKDEKGNEKYGNLPGTNVVPDYPDGSTIDLYAVYRERSLVFVEYLKSSDGSVKETVMYAAPWTKYSSYPNVSYDKNKFDGYKLLGWGVNAHDIAAPRYPETEAEWNTKWKDQGLLEEYKQEAARKATNDIIVYTIYVAQPDETGITLTATKDPTAIQPTSTRTKALPTSLVAKQMSYQIISVQDGNMPEFVTVQEMQDNAYNDEYANKVAVEILVYEEGHTDGYHAPKWSGELSEDGKSTPQLMGNAALKAGDQVVLKLYHSKVIEQNITYKFDLKFTFADLPDQIWTFKNVKIELVPTEYTVNYTAIKPSDSLIEEEDWTEKGFSGENNKQYTATVQYGGNLIAEGNVPELVGYKANGNWTYTNPETNETEKKSYSGTPKLDFAVSDENRGVIDLSTEYIVNNYKISADLDKLKDKWTVTYGTQNTELANAGVEIPYHTLVTFTAAKENDYPEFISLKIGDTETTLDKIETTRQEIGDSVAYSFYMPANNVHATYDDVMELYLETDTIKIYPDKFHYLGKDVTWHGKYVILMDEHNNVGANDTVKTTNNVLELNGDLNGRDIQLGNLNIKTENSISLADNTTAALTTDYTKGGSEITALNIRVPATANLTIKGEAEATEEISDKGKLILSPKAGYAAIGGWSEGNGEIHLENLEITMTMPVGSSSSGIGQGNNQAGGDVDLTHCKVTVSEGVAETGKQPYDGAWIGGSDITNVVLTDTEIYGVEGAKIVDGPKVVYGNNVTLNACIVGTEATPVTNPIVAKSRLELTGTESNHTTIYQTTTNGTQPLQAVVVYDMDKNPSVLGEIVVTYTDVNAVVETADQSALYHGELKICDNDSDIVIEGTQILDINNGDIEIEDSTVEQDGITHEHSGIYVLLDAFNSTAKNDLTMNTTRTVQVYVKAMEVGKITAYGNADVTLEGNVTVSDTVQIDSGMTLKVNADVSETISFTGDLVFNEDSLGTYEQSGGMLTSTNNFEGENLTVKLNSVTATVPAMISKELTLNGCTVEATAADADENKVGSCGASGKVTTVNITNSTVDAETIGALGAQNETFTFVNVDEASKLTGTLVQDHYRLKYVLEDNNFEKIDDVPLDSEGTNNETLDTVFRTSKQFNAGTVVNNTYEASPEVPNDPMFKLNTPSYFGTWYVKDGDNKIAVNENSTVEGFTNVWTALDELKAKELTEVTDPADGTKTLKLYAWMRIQGTGVIKEGRLLDTFDDATAQEIEVKADSSWTAKFTIKGNVFADGEFNFATPIPGGTRLTLVHIPEGETVPDYYYYIVPEESTKRVVKFADFKIMGGTTAATLMDDRTEVNDICLLAADFSNAEAEVKDYGTVTFEIGEGDAALPVATVSYELIQKPAATISVQNDKITVNYDGDSRLADKHLYLVAELSKAVSYVADNTQPATLALGSNTSEGKVFSGNLVVFDIGECTERKDEEYTFQFNNLAYDDYKINWYLTAAKAGTDNIFDKELAITTSELSVANTQKSMQVTLTSIDGKETSSRVLTAGTSHILTFKVVNNQEVPMSDVVVTAEKQGVLANFNEAAGMTYTKSDDGTVTVTLPADWTRNSYRICFSCTENEQRDNKYFTFILEDAN